MVVNAKKKKAHQEAFEEYVDGNMNEQAGFPEEVMSPSQSKKVKLPYQESSAQRDPSEADDEKSASNPTHGSGEKKEENPKEVKEISVDLGSQ